MPVAMAAMAEMVLLAMLRRFTVGQVVSGATVALVVLVALLGGFLPKQGRMALTDQAVMAATVVTASVRPVQVWRVATVATAATVGPRAMAVTPAMAARAISQQTRARTARVVVTVARVATRA